MLELLITIAILGLLATFVTIRFTGAQAGARDTRRLSDLRQYQTAIEAYASTHSDHYPAAGSNPANPFSLCGPSPAPLGPIPCAKDPKDPSQQYQYSVNASLTSYILWARLEKPLTPTTYFVFCSTGNSGKLTNNPPAANGTCPDGLIQ